MLAPDSFFFKGNTTEIPAGQGRLNIYNGFDCHVFLKSNSLQLQHQIGPLEMFNVSHVVVSQNVSGEVIRITLGFESKCNVVSDNYELNTTLTIIEGKVKILILSLYICSSVLTSRESTQSLNFNVDIDLEFSHFRFFLYL